MLGIADLAEALGTSRSSAHRYMITLVVLGFLEQDRSRKYRLALRARDLGTKALDATGLREISHPYLVALRDDFGHAVSLGVLDGVEVVCVDHASGLCPVRQGVGGLGLRPGSRLPAYCTALGKILLAYLPGDVRRARITEMTLVKRSANTITRKRGLTEVLSEIADTGGLAVSDEELAPGVYSIAAPIRDQHGIVIAAIDVTASAPSTRSLGHLLDAADSRLESVAEHVSAVLGFQRGGEQGEDSTTIDQASL